MLPSLSTATRCGEPSLSGPLMVSQVAPDSGCAQAVAACASTTAGFDGGLPGTTTVSWLGRTTTFPFLFVTITLPSTTMIVLFRPWTRTSRLVPTAAATAVAVCTLWLVPGRTSIWLTSPRFTT